MASGLPPEIEPIDYVARWRNLVVRRRVQMDAAYAANGLTSNDYWAKRAKTYRQALHQHGDDDPFFVRLKRDVDTNSTVLDVGAGTGRHTLALAPLIKRVTSVEPSAAMLQYLRRDAEEQSLTNVKAVNAAWLDAEVETADFVICSHVLYPIDDVVPFIRRLDAHARKRVFVYLRVDPMPTDMGLWQEFYGVALQLQPTALDLLNVLAQIGISADLAIVEHRFAWTFENMEEAVAQMSNTLCLRESDEAATGKLCTLLEQKLVRWPDGRLGPDIASAKSAIISWPPSMRP